MKSFFHACQVVVFSLLCTGCIVVQGPCAERFTQQEKSLISASDSLMHVYQITDSAELKVLRAVSRDFHKKDLQSPLFAELCTKMLATVNDTANPGVGIAAPQVGINRRLIAVQRFDKEGEPFEVYANITLEPVGTETQDGPEGCLSIPDRRETVTRYKKIAIRYTDPATLHLQVDTVEGFTAVIFQHETDHLEGILFTDRVE